MRRKYLLALILFGLTVFSGFSMAFLFSQAEQPIMEDRIEVFKKAKKLRLYNQGRVYEYPIGTGKNPADKKRVGDKATPLGKFKIVSIEKSDHWAYDFGDGKGPIVGAYGPWFLRFDGPWVGIAIHGTHDESTIGKDDSQGCIRMRNQDLIQLKSMVYPGYPVEVFD